MITTMNRRSLLAMSAVVPAAMLGACSVVSSGGSTAVTIDVAALTRDGLALVASLEAVLAAPALVSLLGPNAVGAMAALAGAQAAIFELQALIGSRVLLTADTSRVQDLVQTLIADAQSVLGIAQPALIGAVSGIGSSVGNYLAAASALLPFLALAASLPMPLAAGAGGQAMSEQEALAVAAGAQ